MTILAYWAGAHFPVLSPRRFLYPLGSGTLGYSWPAALGAAVALGQPTLAVAGDGGFLYGVQELATARQYGLPTTLLLVDDGGYGILREYQRDAYGETFAVDLEQPDFPELARSFGVPVESTTPDALGDALGRALASGGPAVVHLPARLEMWTLDPLTMTDWSSLVRPSLVGLEPYRPGPSLSELRREHGLDEIAKLNWNEDLFGPLPGALDAVKDELANAWMYPEQAYSDLREAVAGWLELPPETIVPAHGIQALIAAVAHTFIREGDAVVVPQPTYGLYAQVSAGAGARVVRVPNRDFRLDLPALADAARSEGAKLVWVCDPNNPTGSLVEAGEWAEFPRRPPGRRGRGGGRGLPRVRRPRPARRQGARRAGRPARRPPSHLLEDLRPRWAPPRLRGRAPRAGAVPRCRAGAVQREPRRPRRGPCLPRAP